MAWRLAARQFGHQRHYPKIKTFEQYNQLYEAHKQLVPNIKKISLQWSQTGSGQTGVRYFKYYSLPPLQHWNKGIEVELQKNKTGKAQVTVELTNGTTAEIPEVGKLNRSEILQRVVSLDPEGQLITDGPGWIGVPNKPKIMPKKRAAAAAKKKGK